MVNAHKFPVHHFYGSILPVGFKGDDIWSVPWADYRVNITSSASDNAHGVRLTDNQNGTVGVHWWFNAYLDVSYVLEFSYASQKPALNPPVSSAIEINTWFTPPYTAVCRLDSDDLPYELKSTW